MASATVGDAQGKQYPVRGKVVSTEPTRGEVTLDAAAIPGFMGAMTMPYKLRTTEYPERVASRRSHNGDAVRNRHERPARPDRDHRERRSRTISRRFEYHVPTPGDAVPDFKFLNQSGKHISIAGFNGKMLL